jgi:translation initiation factor IF-2
MAKVRVFQLARELSIESHDIIARLKDLGVAVKTASSSVDEDTADKLKRAVKIDALENRKKRIYGSEDDDAERDAEAKAVADRIAEERAAREKAADEARQAAASRKARRARAAARAAGEKGEGDEASPALAHPAGRPRLRRGPFKRRPAAVEEEEAETAEGGAEAPSPVVGAAVVPEVEAVASEPAPAESLEPPETAQQSTPEAPPTVAPVAAKRPAAPIPRGPAKPIAPKALPPPPPPAATRVTRPNAIPIRPPVSASGPRPGIKRPLRPIASPRPAGPHPTTPRAGVARPRLTPPAVPGRPGLRPVSPIPARQRPAPPPPHRPHSARPGPRRRDRRNAPAPPVKRDERPAWTGPLRAILLSEGVTVKELGEKMDDVKSRDIIKTLIGRGIMATLNQTIEPELAIEICKEFGYEATIQTFEEEVSTEQVTESAPEDLRPRGPVVTVMGHVDHGKTSLLDAIRQTAVADGEAGGITQHIGAYHVDVGPKRVVFLDTPGHEAFTLMRARGAKVTDIVVLVVAADDGVMPQTIEAIDHAKAAGVPIIVAVNKIDKPGAQVDRVKQQLADRDLLAEDWGGTTVFVNVSAKEKQNLDQLLEMILLVADLQELKANPDRPAIGTVIEARVDKGRGPVANVVVQDGTIRVGDTIVAGAVSGKVRALVDDKGVRLKLAGPSTPVEILGLSSMPEPGDQMLVVADASKAQQIASFRQIKLREQTMSSSSRVRLHELSQAIAEGQLKELPLVIKGDVQGSVEAVADQVRKLPQDKIKLRIIRTGAGAISEWDVLLAGSSNAIVIGFNVRPEKKASEIAARDDVELRLYTVIYDVVDDIKKAMEGLLDPTEREVPVGQAEVRQTFKISRLGTIAGSYVIEGKAMRNAQVRLLRDNVVIHTGKIGSLRRFKDDATEVKTGLECGISLASYNDIKPGDVFDFFVLEKVKETLES